MCRSPIFADLPVSGIGEARDFYVDYLGLSIEVFNIGWVARSQSPDRRAVIQLVTRDATAPQDPVISVAVGDSIEGATRRRGDEASRSSTRSLRSPGAVPRFFVRAHQMATSST